MKRWIFGIAILSAAWCAAAWADNVYLDDGRKYEGTVTDEGECWKVATKMGTLSFPKAKVTRIEKVKDLVDTYREKQAAIKDGDAEGHYKLALWCRDQKLAREMNTELERTIGIDPNHEGARAALNFVRIDGTWMKAKPGMVFVANDWIKPEDAILKGKAFYRAGNWAEAYKAFDGAAKNLKKDADVAEAELNLALAAERLAKWSEAKSALGAVLAIKENVEQKSAAEAHKSVLDACAGGMYLVKEPTGKDDIFSLNNEQKSKQKALVGLQPLSNPDVMNIALRENCTVYIEKGKELLKQAKDAYNGTPEGDAKTAALLDQAEAQFQMADRSVKDIARGYLVECVKQRITILGKPFDLKMAHVRGQMMAFEQADAKAKMGIAKNVLTELDDLSKPLEAIQRLAATYPDELAQTVASAKGVRSQIDQWKAVMTGMIGK